MPAAKPPVLRPTGDQDWNYMSKTLAREKLMHTHGLNGLEASDRRKKGRARDRLNLLQAPEVSLAGLASTISHSCSNHTDRVHRKGGATVQLIEGVNVRVEHRPRDDEYFMITKIEYTKTHRKVEQP